MRTGIWVFSTVVLLSSVGCGQSSTSDAPAEMSMAGKSAIRPGFGMGGGGPTEELKQNLRANTFSDVNGASASDTSVAQPSLAAFRPNPTPPIPQRSIIRNADLAVRVKSIEPSEHDIEKLIIGEGGYVDSASSSDLASDHPEIKLALRVPVADFDTTINSVEGMGVRLSKTVNSQDVTGQLIDLDARLTTMSDEEHVYQGLLRESHSLESAIQLRDKLTDLRSQIESIAGQRKSMGELASLSSVTVTLTQSSVSAAPPVDAGWFQESWGQASTFALGATRAVIGLGMWLLALMPFWLPAGALVWRFVLKPRRMGATIPSPISTIQ